MVKVTPSGVSETTSELQDQQETFEETADTASEQTGKLEAFSERWAGALQVFTAGLAVAAAGLLSQVPVLGEVFAGLEAIITAVALAMDSVLRPVLTPLTKGMFGLADTIAQAEGPWRTLIGVIGTVVSIIGVVIGVLAVLGPVISAVVGAVGTLSSVFTAAAGVIGAIIAILGGPLTLLILAIIGIIAALALAWETNFLGIRDVADDVISGVITFFEGLVNWLTNDLPEAVAGFADTMVAGFQAVLSGAISFAGDFVRTVLQAVSRVRAVFETFRAAIQTAFETLGELVVNALKVMGNRAVRAIENAINAAISLIPSEVRGAIGISTVSIADPFETRAGEDILAAGGRRFERRRGAIEGRASERESDIAHEVSQLVTALQNTVQETTIEMDSQTVAEETRPFIGEDAANRGRSP